MAFAKYLPLLLSWLLSAPGGAYSVSNRSDSRYLLIQHQIYEEHQEVVRRDQHHPGHSDERTDDDELFDFVQQYLFERGGKQRLRSNSQNGRAQFVGVDNTSDIQRANRLGANWSESDRRYKMHIIKFRLLNDTGVVYGPSHEGRIQIKNLFKQSDYVDRPKEVRQGVVSSGDKTWSPRGSSGTFSATTHGSHASPQPTTSSKHSSGGTSGSTRKAGVGNATYTTPHPTHATTKVIARDGKCAKPTTTTRRTTTTTTTTAKPTTKKGCAKPTSTTTTPKPMLHGHPYLVIKLHEIPGTPNATLSTPLTTASSTKASSKPSSTTSPGPRTTTRGQSSSSTRRTSTTRYPHRRRRYHSNGSLEKGETQLLRSQVAGGIVNVLRTFRDLNAMASKEKATHKVVDPMIEIDRVLIDRDRPKGKAEKDELADDEEEEGELHRFNMFLKEAIALLNPSTTSKPHS